jgi:hypothetical protein
VAALDAIMEIGEALFEQFPILPPRDVIYPGCRIPLE